MSGVEGAPVVDLLCLDDTGSSVVDIYSQDDGGFFFCFESVVLLSRYMQPVGLWQRHRRCLSQARGRALLFHRYTHFLPPDQLARS